MKKLYSKLSFLKSFKNAPQAIAAWFQNISEFCLVSQKKLHNLGQTNFELGLNHLRRGNLYDAAFRFKLVTRFHPQHAEAYYHWARCLILQNKKAAAKEKIEKAIALGFSQPEGKYVLSKLTNPSKITETPATIIYEKYHAITDNLGNVIEQPVSSALNEKRIQFRRTIVETLMPHITDKNPRLHVLDLDCENGTCGSLLKQKNITHHIIGSDPSTFNCQRVSALSHKEESIYNSVVCNEARQFLKENKDTFDLIIAPYILGSISKVESLLNLLVKKINPSGFLILISKNTPDADYLFDILDDSFSHSTAYLTDQITKSGLKELQNMDITLPENSEGTLFICQNTR